MSMTAMAEYRFPIHLLPTSEIACISSIFPTRRNYRFPRITSAVMKAGLRLGGAFNNKS